MIEFFRDNYQWIFSGIGVFFLAWIINHFTKKKTEIATISNITNSNALNLQHSNNNTIQIIEKQVQENIGNETKDNNFINIEPETIRNEIKSLPVYQQDDAGKNYTGLRIKWNLSLGTIIKKAGNSVTVIMRTKDYFSDICFTADIEKYPILKSAKPNQPFEIIGKIIKCSKIEITIELESLRIKDLI